MFANARVYHHNKNIDPDGLMIIKVVFSP